ncbi:MAG: hypothetical protein NC935_04975 [Candidatus Omnitrophica bacterium]|nr:hypothetical protein [Candidatus Omnitrophota bacterium]
MNITNLYLIYLFGYIFSRGIFNISGLVILFFSLVLFTFYKPKLEKTENLSWLLIYSIILSILTDRLLYPSTFYINLLIKFFLTSALLFTYFKKITFPVLVAIGFCLRILIIIYSPNPQIDVYYLLKEAPNFLLKGINPYSAIYTKVYENVTPDYYTYFPSSIILFTPFSLNLGDPRWLNILVYLLVYYVIFRTVADKNKSKILFLLIFYQPLSLLVFEQGFLEILLLGLVSLIVYLISIKKESLASLVMAIALSTKQSMFLIIPFFWNQLYKKRSNLLITFVPFMLITTPFLLWNFQDFWYDTIYYLFNMDKIRTDMVYFSLNMLTFLRKTIHFNPTSIPFYPLLILLVIYYLFRKRLKRQSLNDTLFNIALFFLSFHLFATQAYVNYFFLIANLLIINQAFVERKIA